MSIVQIYSSLLISCVSDPVEMRLFVIEFKTQFVCKFIYFSFHNDDKIRTRIHDHPLAF